MGHPQDEILFQARITLGALFDFGKALKVKVAARNDADNGFPLNVVSHVFERVDGERACRLKHDPLDIEHFNQCGAKPVFADLKVCLVIECTQFLKGELAYFGNGCAIDERVNTLKSDWLACVLGRSEAGATSRLNKGIVGFAAEVGCDTSRQPPAAHGQNDKVWCLAELLFNFCGDCGLPHDDIICVKGWQEDTLLGLAISFGSGEGFIKKVTDEFDFDKLATKGLCLHDLLAGRCDRHKDPPAHAKVFAHESNALGVVARTCADKERRVGAAFHSVGHSVKRTANFVRAHRCEVFTFEQNVCAVDLGQVRIALERGGFKDSTEGLGDLAGGGLDVIHLVLFYHESPQSKGLRLQRRVKRATSRQTRQEEITMSAPKKVVLAYSGGLDTSIILKWLETEYGCEVVTFTADLGQGEELEPARAKAELMGVKDIYIEDVREEFVRDFVFPMFRANAVYEGLYLLGTSIARPLISKRLVEIAEEVGADAVAHGATGKGNDQVRFELACYALNPDIKVIAPWREWDLTSRTKLIDFAEKHQIPIAKDKRGEAPFSVDANLLHTSSEGKVLEDPAEMAPDYVYQRTVSPEDAPNEAEYIEVGFERGDAVSINGEAMSPATILTKLNELGGKHGIGRLDFVENRFVGMKSRGIYETPGGTVLLEAHRGIEQITLDSGAGHLKDSLMPRYAELIYNGFWYSPEREMLQAAIDKSQEHVTGTVKLKLYKGAATCVGRWSDHSLYSEAHVTFEDDAGAYDQKDAAGFIQLNALRLKLLATRNRRFK